MLPKDYLERRDHIQELHAQLISEGERQVTLLTTLLERAQLALTGYQHMLRQMIRYDAGLLTPDETAAMFAVLKEYEEKGKKVAGSSSKTQTKSSTVSPTQPKRTRKRSLQDEVIKPTDDLT